MDERAKEFLKDSTEKAKEFAVQVDKRVRDNPWPFIAGAAVVSALVGVLIGGLIGKNSK